MHKSLSEYTDEEIAAEHHLRAMRKLGDQRVAVAWPPLSKATQDQLDAVDEALRAGAALSSKVLIGR